MAKLYVLSGDDVGRSYAVEGDSALLGRGKDADVLVRGASVSRSHARLERTAAGWQLTDLGSSNGIRIDGRRVSAGDLVDGDTFHLGEIELRFRDEDATAGEPPPQPTFAERAAETDFVAPPSTPTRADDAGVELEGDWDEGADLAIEPVRSAPKSPAPQQRAQPTSDQRAKSAAGRRADALGRVESVGGARATTGGGRILQYHKVENRAGLFGAEVGQQTTGTRLLIYALLAVFVAGIAWGAFTLTSSAKRNAALIEGEGE